MYVNYILFFLKKGRNRLINTENKLVVARGEGTGGMGKMGEGE